MTIEIRHKKKWYWVLLAANGKVWATSETYANKGNCERATKDLRDYLWPCCVAIRYAAGLKDDK